VHCLKTDSLRIGVTYSTGVPDILPSHHQLSTSATMSQQQHQLDALKEARMQFALQAMKQDATLSQRRAAALYKVSHTTLSDRRAGKPPRADYTPKSRNLDKNKKEMVVLVPTFRIDLSTRTDFSSHHYKTDMSTELCHPVVRQIYSTALFRPSSL
jgi:hypothetical protein